MSLICGGLLAYDILNSTKTVFTLSTVVAMIANGSTDNWKNVFECKFDDCKYSGDVREKIKVFKSSCGGANF